MTTFEHIIIIITWIEGSYVFSSVVTSRINQFLAERRYRKELHVVGPSTAVPADAEFKKRMREAAQRQEEFEAAQKKFIEWVNTNCK